MAQYLLEYDLSIVVIKYIPHKPCIVHQVHTASLEAVWEECRPLCLHGRIPKPSVLLRDTDSAGIRKMVVNASRPEVYFCLTSNDVFCMLLHSDTMHNTVNDLCGL